MAAIKSPPFYDALLGCDAYDMKERPAGEPGEPRRWAISRRIRVFDVADLMPVSQAQIIADILPLREAVATRQWPDAF